MTTGRFAPHGRRSKSRESSEGFEIAIPAKQSLAVPLIVGPSLIVCGVRATSAALNLFFVDGDRTSTPSLIAWTCLCVFLLYVQLWMIIGVEYVVLREETLLIRREFGGFDRSKEYDLSRIVNLRVESGDRRRALHFLGVGSGPIAFDYGSKTVRFGTGVHEIEAREIVEKLRSRYPF